MKEASKIFREGKNDENNGLDEDALVNEGYTLKCTATKQSIFRSLLRICH
jgi:hypothetical protein